MAAPNIHFFVDPTRHFGRDDKNCNVIRKELCNLGLFMVFCGASLVFCAIPPRSVSGENIFMAFALSILGNMMILLSFAVNLFPRAAAAANVVLKQAVFILVIWFVWMNYFSHGDRLTVYER